MQLFKENTCLESRIGLNLLSTFDFQLSAFNCQLSIFVKPKSKVPKSRPKGLGLTLKSHGPPSWLYFEILSSRYDISIGMTGVSIQLVILWDSLLQV